MLFMWRSKRRLMLKPWWESCEGALTLSLHRRAQNNSRPSFNYCSPPSESSQCQTVSVIMKTNAPYSPDLSAQTAGVQRKEGICVCVCVSVYMGFMGDVCEGMWQGLHSSTSCSSFHLILGILNFVAGDPLLWGSGDDQRGSFYVCHLQETDTVNTPTTYTTSQTQDSWAGYSLPAALYIHAQKTDIFI